MRGIEFKRTRHHLLYVKCFPQKDFNTQKDIIYLVFPPLIFRGNLMNLFSRFYI